MPGRRTVGAVRETLLDACEGFSWRDPRDGLLRLAALAEGDTASYNAALLDLITQAATPDDVRPLAPALAIVLSIGSPRDDRLADAARSDDRVATALMAFVGLTHPEEVLNVVGREHCVRSWLRLQEFDRRSDDFDWAFWAWELLNDLISLRPFEEAWPVVEQLLEAADGETLGAVAAGPREDLLARNWQAVLDVTEAAPKDAAVRSALGCVNLPDMPSGAARRFEQLALRPDR